MMMDAIGRAPAQVSAQNQGARTWAKTKSVMVLYEL